ncbi:MAG: cache domain-containing protein, partial [Lachnospiraceae bacterium]|nr:cache domain-containing protein [Lachnospiraceae bacterium]
MKLARVTKKGNRTFYIEFMLMTLAPLIVCGIVMIIVCSRSMSKAMKDEVSDNLKNVALSVRSSYNMRYPGEWEVKTEGEDAADVTLYKGGVLVSDNYDFLDGISEESQLEISIFYMDTRLLTTLRGTDNERLEMTVASGKIVDDVYRGKSCVFYDNVTIASSDYYAYYEPILSEGTGECIGMIGVAKTSDSVKKIINGFINRNILVMILGI